MLIDSTERGSTAGGRANHAEKAAQRQPQAEDVATDYLPRTPARVLRETQVRADAEVEPYFCAYACVAEAFNSVERSTLGRPAGSCESISVYGQADGQFCAVAMPKKEKR
jgi:hypothetical protein